MMQPVKRSVFFLDYTDFQGLLENLLGFSLGSDFIPHYVGVDNPGAMYYPEEYEITFSDSDTQGLNSKGEEYVQMMHDMEMDVFDQQVDFNFALFILIKAHCLPAGIYYLRW